MKFVEEQIPIIIGQRRRKDRYNYMSKYIKNFSKIYEICQIEKMCRANLSSPIVITETARTAYDRIDNLESNTKNNILTIGPEVTILPKHTQWKTSNIRSI